jgi:OOP family OmpA-OmpF porin
MSHGRKWFHCGAMTMLCSLVCAAANAGYLVDGSGSVVRSGFGACVRIDTGSAHIPIEACDPVTAVRITGRVVLLPGPDGRAGVVTVRNAQGESRLDAPYAAVEVSSKGTQISKTESANSVLQRYSTSLDALPPRPVSFIVYFATGSATKLAAESIPVIEAIKKELAQWPAPELTVIGHADRVGNDVSNDLLSLQRAESVRDTLLAAGVQGLSMVATGRGEREPLVPTTDGVPELRNRRVEINLR